MIISIIIPSFNSYETIIKCVESIFNCENTDLIELIIIDDHSTDNSLQAYEEIKRKYHSVIIIDNKIGVKSACLARYDILKDFYWTVVAYVSFCHTVK